MKTVRNPMFWNDALIPLLDAIREGNPTVKVFIDPRSGVAGMECEVRLTRVGNLRIPRGRQVTQEAIAKANTRKASKP